MPYAIEEADNLYAKHMHVSLALYQMWRTREDCILDESGLQNLPSSVSGDLGPGGSSLTDRKYSIVSLPSTTFSHRAAPDETEQNEVPDVALPDMVLLQNALKDAEHAIAKAEQEGNRSERRKAKERREDILRLMRVEAIYVSSFRSFSGTRTRYQTAFFSESHVTADAELGHCLTKTATSHGHCDRRQSSLGECESVSCREW